MDFIDIRQSDAWSNYLKMYGWISWRLPSGAVLRTTKFPFFSVAKIHRAHCLNRNDLKEAERVYKANKVLYSKISPSVDQDLSVLESFGYKRRGGIDLPPRTIFINLRHFGRCNRCLAYGKLLPDCFRHMKRILLLRDLNL